MISSERWHSRAGARVVIFALVKYTIKSEERLARAFAVV
jgi:hypothetical protein